MRVSVERHFKNPGREAAHIEGELARRLCLLGVRLEDSAAIRQLFSGASQGNVGRQLDSTTSDLLGLGLVMVKVLRQSASAGSGLRLQPATRAFVDAMLGTRDPQL